jgi:hypothetical protein
VRECTYFLGSPDTLADVLAVLQHRKDLLHGGLFLFQLLHLQALTTAPGLLDELRELLLDELNILETQLLGDDVQVTDRIDVALDVDNLGIVEAPDDLEDGIDGADVRQEGVAETSTSGCTARQTSNVVDRQIGRHLRFGFVLLYQPVEALIGDDDARLFGVDGGIWKILRGSDTGCSAYDGRLTAGLPSEHLVMAWKRVDLPTFARPTWRRLLM